MSTIFIKSRITYIDGDINPALARNVVDITQIQYPNDYFDFIICSHVLGHIPDEKKAIQELYRVLKTDGIALIMTLLDTNRAQTFEDSSVTTSQEKLLHYGESDLCRLHGLDFLKRIEREGFSVAKIDYRMLLGAENSNKFSLGDGQREIIYRCTKGK
ncbi:MAG: class I SAM-dependent methyltransferase [Cytophagales bacterium]